VSTLDRIEPPRYIAWRGRTLTIDAYHEWWLEPRDVGTHVRTLELFTGLLARLLRGMLQKTLDMSLKDGLERLKREAERRSPKA
jgi:hypothetical protein